jgi:hypothetical protein
MTKVSLKIFAAGLALALVASCGSRHAAKGTSDGEAPDGDAAADGGPPDAGQETAVLPDAAVEASSPDAPSDSTPNLDSLTSPDVLAADADAVADVPADAASAGDVAADADAAGIVDGAAEAESRSPSCLRGFISDWRAPLQTLANHWMAISGTQGTPSVDTTAGEALLPRDSRVWTLVSPSDFVLEFDVTIDGDLTFFVDTYGPNHGPLPSITRAGSQLVFSTAFSGATAIAPGGGFTGQRVPAQKVHVTLWGETGGHRLGMKVDAAGQTFWSGFANLDHPTQYLMLVGANLAAEQGTTAHVHVGQMTGCERVFKDDCLEDPTHLLAFCPTAGPSAPPL